MAIEKNSYKVARFNRNKDGRMSSEEENERNYIESDGEEDGYEDCESGAGSDDFDLLELGETGEEFCQVGDQTCGIPYELYDLPGLKDVLSMEVWNEVLTEEERFGLAKFLPDMDQENFVCTMKELFAGDNLHFGNPVTKLFEMLKGGLCEPRVALYRQGSNFFKMNKYYHRLRKHQNSMVTNVCQIRDAWRNYKGYSIEEKLQMLNIMRSQKSLMNENIEELKSDSSEREQVSGDVSWGKRVKEPNLGQKTGRYSGYGESVKHGKQNSRGALKLAGPKSTSLKRGADPFISPSHGVEMKSGRFGFGGPSFRYDNHHTGNDSSVAVRVNEDVGEVETMYEVAVHRDQNFPVMNDSRGAMKYWKKQEGARTGEGMDSFVGMPGSGRNDVRSSGRNKGVNQLSDINILTAKPSHPRNTFDGGEHVNLQQFAPENYMRRGKVPKTSFPLKGSQTEVLDEVDPVWLAKQHGGLLPADLSYKLSESSAKTMKWKTGRDAPDHNASNKVLHADFGSNTSKGKARATTLQNERNESVGGRGMSMFPRSEDTESDSSEHEDDDGNPLMRSKWAYPGGVPDLRHGPNMKATNLSKRDKKDSYVNLDAPGRSSRSMEEYGHNMEMLKAEQRGKMHDAGYMNILPSKHLEATPFPFPANSTGYDNPYKFYPLGTNGHSQGYRGENFHMPSVRPPFIPERRLKGDVRREFGVPHPNNMQDSNFDDESFWSRPLASMPLKLGKKGQMVEMPSSYQSARSDVPLMVCNTVSKKRKVKDDFTYMGNNNNYLNADSHLQDDITLSGSRKRGKNKVDEVPDFQENGISEPVTMDVETEIVEPEIKPQKKQFPLITPTVHTGFSFSVIHLLSAVRMAMITFLPDDSSAGKDQDKSDGKDQNKNDPGEGLKENDSVEGPKENNSGEGPKEEQEKKQEDKPNMNVYSSTPSNVPSLTIQPSNVPSLTIQEIVNRVKSNPGDPSILETQEPLQDLIRGVLKIFSSRTAPLGAKGWKALVVYEKSSKSWSWIGPLSQNLSDPDEEVTSPDAWGLPHKMLVKLVDTFANWLKNSQDTLQQIGTLPTPPLELMQINIDEKERFKDLRAQKSLSTISQSSEEVRAYFRKEELLRYLIPDRTFCYTAIDGKKSIVAPLRRCGGKPTSKARDHFMLKRDRPPHVTILCLVRDAASRLPGSIGTRADVCTLIRDSQYIVEDVSDAQVNQVVSGALDRLHYERDPCVQFDGERKLWVYLHRDREEEDFEDDGTSSTKKWRRPKKETTETPEQGDVTVVATGTPELGDVTVVAMEIPEQGDATVVAMGTPELGDVTVVAMETPELGDVTVVAMETPEQGDVTVVADSVNVEPSKFDMVSDLNVEASFTEDGKRSKPDDYLNDNDQNEVNPETSHGNDPVILGGFELNPVEEKELICQENSMHEVFGEDALDGDPPP